ncbi:unnamed protein product [Aphanomyces euteiches]|uniref:Vesicle transport protein USE1 n=1 Tax=Aphanomyces euteiches TaxID=100861 RepID=A0A6G0WW51_9STRA|nr:hypothetical protein Ae201684_011075 [Aphanomyces euteiches]KAH9058569.1 hypothetical protein Ae201684P_005912 [Aphanomyces euteiches]KAH9126497.1 hypothetical protein AeMF1_003068 [Aphanomyces euteiches]KAH9132864.1 hypothetical protein AeRB84_020928 [Aphanomyces euteiches]KAH9135842.1 hypothetical protein LEN26_006358 [Aphanomyces euteiches]
MTTTKGRELRYQRLIHTCKAFLASTSTAHVTNTDIAKYLRCIQFELKAIQADDSLVNSPFHDDLLAIEADLKHLQVPTEDKEYRFPTHDQLRERRKRMIALRNRSSTGETGAMDVILSHMENKATSAWEDKNASLMDDEFMSFSTDDIVATKAKPPSISAIREQLGLVPSHSKDRTSLSAAKSIEEKEKLEAELKALSSQLKHATQGLNQNLKADAHLLDQVALDAEANQAKLDQENRRLKVQLESRISFFTTVYLILGLFVVFIGMYVFMKIFSKRHYPLF